MLKLIERLYKRVSKLELRRQTFHLFFGIAIVLLLYFNIIRALHLFIALIFGTLVSIVSIKYDVPIISWFLDKFERQEYRRTFPGKAVIMFVFGSLVVLILCPKNIALAAILVLSIGDATAHVFGKLLSRRQYAYFKSIEGTLIGFVTAFLGALIFVNPLSAAVGSFAGMMSETIKNKLFDDNILVPTIAGAVMWMLI